MNLLKIFMQPDRACVEINTYIDNRGKIPV